MVAPIGLLGCRFVCGNGSIKMVRIDVVRSSVAIDVRRSLGFG